MIQFIFKHNNETIAIVENVSILSNKKVWKLLEEAITHDLKTKLSNELSPIREKLEKESVCFIYNFNPVSEDFDITYNADPQLSNLIERFLKK